MSVKSSVAATGIDNPPAPKGTVTTNGPGDQTAEGPHDLRAGGPGLASTFAPRGAPTFAQVRPRCDGPGGWRQVARGRFGALCAETHGEPAEGEGTRRLGSCPSVR